MNEKNLLSVPQLEFKADWYLIHYTVHGGWDIKTPAGNFIHFTKDSGMCAGMPFIDLLADPSVYMTNGTTDGISMVQTVQANYNGFTKDNICKAKVA